MLIFKYNKYCCKYESSKNVFDVNLNCEYYANEYKLVKVGGYIVKE